MNGYCLCKYMSFCNDIKSQLAEIKTPKRLRLPLIYGMLMFGRSFSYNKIGIQTSSGDMAELYSSLLRECFKAETETKRSNGARPTFRATVTSDTDRLRILAAFDFGMYTGAFNSSVFEPPGSEAAFIRGAFLACGSINDPERGYRAEFSVRSEQAATALRDMLNKNEVPANKAKRGSAFSVYTGSSEGVINLLTLLGATERSLELIETTIMKSVKNNMNRARNCDNANISKTVEASIAQRQAIAYLEQTGRLQTLEAPLYTAAVLRRDNPDLSLHELCRLSPEPITVSGLNHRLQKLMELYNEANESRDKK